MSWLGLDGKTILVLGVANRRSVAFHVGRQLKEAGARVVWSVHTEERREELRGRLEGDSIYVCDVEKEEDIEALRESLARDHPELHGMVHSIAFANYSDGKQPFHDTNKRDFLQAVDVSAYSLMRLAGALRELFHEEASVVAMSISTTRMASESYGYMGPVKAALDSAVVFLAKSFSGLQSERALQRRPAPVCSKTSVVRRNPGLPRELPVRGAAPRLRKPWGRHAGGRRARCCSSCPPVRPASTRRASSSTRGWT